MTSAEVDAYVAEFVRRFEARTPSRDILDVLPHQRVGRGEMRTWFLTAYGRLLTLDDAVQLDVPLQKAFKTLRKKYPNERW